MKNLLPFKKYAIKENSSEYPFLIYYKNKGVRTSKGANTKGELLSFAETEGLKEYEIFRNDPNFNSTTQHEFLLGWYDIGGSGYWTTRAKAEPIVLRKKITK